MMKTETLETLNNSYMADIEEKTLKQEVIQKRLQNQAKNMRDTVTKMQLGDDSKVDEAVMISFFAALFEDIAKGYQQFKALGYQLKLDKLEADKDSLNTKLDNIKVFKEHSERVNRYTQLNIEKTSLENTIKELQEQALKNRKEGIVTITDEEDPLADAQKRLGQVLLEMDNIADFYGYETNENFIQDLEESEKKWYGEGGASYLKAARSLDTDAAETLLKTSAGLSTMDQDKVAELNEDIKSELVSQLYHATVGGAAATEVERLAQESTEVLKEQNHTEFGTKSSHPVQDFV